MTRDEWSGFFMGRIQHHIHEYTAAPGRHAKVDAVIKNLGSWPSGWNASAGEVAVIFGVVCDTLADSLEQLGQLQPAK